MALQDLTPQLRTRLSRMERAVGWFVLFAITLLLFGFCYYVYHMAQRKGWFLVKAPYFTFVATAEGLRVGDPVRLMGFDAGTVQEVTPMPANDFTYNVYVKFTLREPNYGYVWSQGSFARIAAADFLGKRVLEVTKGTGGYPTYVSFPLRTVPVDLLAGLPGAPDKWLIGEKIFDLTGTNLVGEPMKPVNTLPPVSELIAAGYQEVRVFDAREEKQGLLAMWNFRDGHYETYAEGKSEFWLLAEESPPVTERLQQVVALVERSLPGVFALTNNLFAVLTNTETLTSNLSLVARDARPAVSNISQATGRLDQPGGLGEWLLPTNLNRQLETTLGTADGTLGSARTTLDTANTNLVALAQSLLVSLDNLGGITSNLNQQVEVNSNILSSISDTVTNAHHFLQGLKRHWLLRSAFKEKESPPPSPTAPPEVLRSPRDEAGR